MIYWEFPIQEHATTTDHSQYRVQNNGIRIPLSTFI